jgi:redox-sensitive bicupin YhaK (pirin superfamily)
MIKLRKSQERGHANHGWLDSYHSFSFAEYFDAAHMQYSALRVINEDVVAGGEGFGMHPHRDMEIVTYILSGSLRHQDSMGNGSVIGVGDVQRMTAGTGVRHSEFNASHDVPVHLLQIWITPSENNLTPSYEEKNFSRQEKENQWRLIASRNGHDGSITIHQDVNLYATILTPQKQEKLPIAPNRCAYVQVVSGEILLEDNQLIAGDAAKISEEQLINILALQESELLWFDLPIQSMQ